MARSSTGKIMQMFCLFLSLFSKQCKNIFGIQEKFLIRDIFTQYMYLDMNLLYATRMGEKSPFNILYYSDVTWLLSSMLYWWEIKP